MSSIQTGIQLNDQFSGVLYGIINSVNLAISGMEEMQSTMNNNVDTSSLEGARDEINAITAELNELNSTPVDMNTGQINNDLNQMTSEQDRFNQEVSEGVNQTNELARTIRNAVGAYLSFQTVKNVIGISDEIVSTTARLNQMNDGLQTTEELTNMVFAAAQDARGSFSDMASIVARFGNNARDAFSSSEEVVAFADLIQKQMTIAGASTDEASNAMLQLSQALGSGVLRGDELNSIFEQAPNLIQSIADYLDVPIGQIRAMAQEGELTADIVKSAIFASADDINAKFEQMPMTWGQIWQSFQNTALMAFQPVLQQLNALANSEAFQGFVNSAIQAMAVFAGIVLNIFDLIGQVGQVVVDNWSWIAPIVYGVLAALMTYGAYLAVLNAIEIASAAAAFVMTGAKLLAAAAMVLFTGATWAATTAQLGLNSALYACPIVWIIMLIIALIAIIYAVCSAIAHLTGIANTGFGIITGGIMVVIAFFKNLGLTVANIALGIANAISALCSNMVTAFSNAIANVQTFFYNLLSTAMSVISQIANALNALPFVEIDVSGLTAAADNYAAKAQEAQDSKGEYESISDAFSEGMGTFDAFEDGWASDAFSSGAEWGDNVISGMGDAVGGFMDNFAVDIPQSSDYTSGFDQSALNALGGGGNQGLDNAIADGINGSGLGGSAGEIAGNTDDIKDSLDITSEDLKYLRDIAEAEAINRFTTAEIKIDYSGMTNNINEGMDIDGVVSHLTEATQEAIESITEGVHE